ncbi:MAG: Crp/Fnr family transcriptional regulator [Myxococcota bacterium]
MDRRKLLANVSIFRDLGDETLDLLLAVTTTKRLEAKQVLFRKGDPGTRLYGVIEGRIKVSSAGADGREMVFGYFDPGEVIGEIALLDSNPRSATVVAMEPSELLSLDRRDFLPFLERHPKLAIHLGEILAARLRRLSETAEDAMFLTLPSRLAKKLLGLATNYGTKTRSGTLIALRLSQQELGELVGTSRESINKQLRTWVQDELLQVERGKITILDWKGLEAFARFTLD